MAPSRGLDSTATTSPPSPPPPPPPPSSTTTASASASTSASTSESRDLTLINARSTHALRSLRTSLSYLISPSSTSSSPSNRPTHLRTRAFLRALRFFSIFLFWRLVRYAKRIAIASLAAGVVSSVAFTGLGTVLMPTGVVGGVVMWAVWGLGRWGARRIVRRTKGKGGRLEQDEEEEEDLEIRDLERERIERERAAALGTGMGSGTGREAMPW